MDMLPTPTNHALYKDHISLNQEMPLPMPVQILPPPHNDTNNILPHMPLNPQNMESVDMKLKSEFVDEESNNGPLDFSLHRIQDIVFNNRNNCTPRRSKAPRVKLTLRETSEQRERRLQKGRERMRNLRANETPEERAIRLLKARKCQERRRQREREVESIEEREQRLLKARERTRLRREQETPEQREKRLRTTRERLRLKRMSESFEERQRRLYLQRERKKEKYHKMTPEEKEMLRLNERHSKHYKTDPNQEKRQTRGICIKYDTFEDDLDEALLKFQNEAPHMTNDSEDATWLAEPEVCLSVGSLENYSPEKNSGSNRENGDSAAAQSNNFNNTNNNNSNNNNNSSSSNNNNNSSSTSTNASESLSATKSTAVAETTETPTKSESVTSTETETSTTNTTSTSSSVPPPQDLQEQLSQHITNVALNISDTGKPYEEPQTYTKMNSCYPPPPQAIPSSHANENYNSYQCNNNQPEYIKNNSSSNCVTVSAPNYNVFHGSGGVVSAAAVAREPNRYQYCAQGYTPQQSNSQVTTVTDSYSHRSHPAFSQTPQPVSHQQISHQSVNHPSVTHQSIAHQTITHHSNYSDHDAPLNLQQHHTQMLPRYGTMC